MMKNRRKRALALCLSGIMVLNLNMPAARAAESNTEKEEVVYGMLSGEGTLKDAYVVNSFTDSNIVDYGDYVKVKNLTTTDEISYENEKICIQTEADKLYYQGDLDVKNTELPWKFEIQYFMDGTEYSPEEIAGKSGSLKIVVSISQNKSGDVSFWEGYALQATMLLDSAKCQNIQADGATIANVGSDKQISYIILPGKGDTLEITADVTNFEMNEISINGTKLNLDIQLDSEELTDQLQEIKDAAEELDEGSEELNDGARKLKKGASNLEDGAEDLKDGVKTLNKGLQSVRNALSKLDKKSKTLTKGSGEVLKSLEKIEKSLDKVNMDATSISQLSAASTQIHNGITSLVSGLKTMDGSIGSYYQALSQSGLSDIDGFINQHNQAIAALGITDTGRKLYQAYIEDGDGAVMTTLGELVRQQDSEAVRLYEEYRSSQNSAVISSYVTEQGKLIQIETLLKGDISYIQGSNQLISGIDTQLDSEKGALMKGAITLQNSYATFDQNIKKLATSLQTLMTNMTELKTGIQKLVKEYKRLDTGIDEYTGGVGKVLTGYKKLLKGSNDLVKGTSEMYQGTTQLMDGVLELKEGTGEMKDGTEEFRDKTKDIDSKVQDKMDEKIDEMTGAKVETGSFVSKKNTKVKSVLFVLKTPAIEIPEQEEVEDNEEEEISILQKFLNLFGFK